MTDEKALSLLKWIPLAIAAGYFVFLIATWTQYVASQKRNQEQFDIAVEKWLASRDTPRPETSE